MARERRKPPEGDDGGSWLTTYGDLMTNLLCFFVLLFSMATVDAQKFESAATSIRTSFAGSLSGESLKQNAGKRILTVNFVNPDDTGDKIVDNERYIENAGEIILDDKEKIKEQKLSAARTQIEKDFEELGIMDLVDIIEENNFLIVRLNSQILFEPGSAEILEEGKSTLTFLANSLTDLDNDIIVEGHTDTVPINTALFPSNWELSTRRATNVVVYLVNNLGLDPSRLTAAGCGEFQPIDDNNTYDGRNRNRRIEFIIAK
jgi:chemotaxis protein MotB